MCAVAGRNTGWRGWFWWFRFGPPAGIWRAETAHAGGVCGLDPIIVRGFCHCGNIVITRSGGGTDLRSGCGIVGRMPPDTIPRGKTCCIPSDSDFISKRSITGGYPGRRHGRHQWEIVRDADHRVVGERAACTE